MKKTLKVEARGEREIVMTRAFDAPRPLVFEAYTKPELLKRWMGAQGGWALAVCECDLRVGGRYRSVWRRGSTEMGVQGVYREVVPPERIVATEQFDQPWYPGEAIVTIELSESAGQTTLTMTLRYESKDARDGVLQTPMETGVAASFDQLEGVLESMARS